MFDISIVLTILAMGIGYAALRIYVNEKKARRQDVLYVCGFVGNDLNGMRNPEDRKREARRLREEARQYMERKGFHFDYTEADKQNEARRQLREEEFEEARIRLRAEYEQQRTRKTAEIIQLAHIRREPSVPIVDVPRKERGIAVLYPKNSEKHQPPLPPRPKRRNKYKKRDGTSNYTLGMDVSPVYGIKRQPELEDKTLRNEYPSLAYEEIEDDYPQDIEEVYQSQLRQTHNQAEQVRIEKHKEEIRTKPVSIQDYFENIRAYDELKKRLSEAI